jgi:hypothetical protein
VSDSYGAPGVPSGPGGGRPLATHSEAQSLADVLERVLDKGIVIVGDIQVRLLDIELLTIKLRLLVASVDKAREMGIDWWESDPFTSAGELEDGDEGEDGSLRRLSQRVRELESKVGGQAPAAEGEPSQTRRRAAKGR